MRPHPTKNKGDLGVLYAQVDLAEKGYGVLVPMTEHESFDLVAYKGGRFCRVQVKYRTAKAGVLEVRFRTSWADRHGTHTLPMPKDDVDVVRVYCPDTRRCYYVDPAKFRNGVKLRVAPARNHQSHGVLHATDFTELPWPLSSARIEQVPSKDKVAGSNPAGVASQLRSCRGRGSQQQNSPTALRS